MTAVLVYLLLFGRYMKNRLTYDQINSLIEEINKAVVGKYKIMQQPLKNLNNLARKQLGRFKDDESKDTKGRLKARLCKV